MRTFALWVKTAGMTEEELRREYAILEKSRRDPRAFGELYEKYFDRIFRFIFRQTDDEDLAADLCSQTFLNALRNVGRYEFRGYPFSAWLYKVATNEINKHYRKQKTEKVFSIEEIRIKELIDQVHGEWDEEVIARLMNYLKELPTEMLEVLELRFYEDKDFREIAFILDITESGAKMRTYRALDRLRRSFNLRIKYDGKE